MLQEIAGSAPSVVKSDQDEKMDERKEKINLGQDRIAHAAGLIITSLGDGFQITDLLPLAVATKEIISSLDEVSNMDIEEESELAVKIMNHIVDQQLGSGHSVAVESIKLAVATAISAAEVVASSTGKKRICCKSCVIL